MFRLHVWMTGSAPSSIMNVNEVISNRCCHSGHATREQGPVHPNDHVNMAQSSNDTFPVGHVHCGGLNVKQRLIPR